MARVLIANESPPERALIRMTMLVSGHQVVEVASGQQAVTMLERTPADVVVLDGSLPDMRIEEAIARIRSLPGRGDVPIIVLIEEPVAEIEGGDVLLQVVHKPFDAHVLRDAVALAAGARRISLEEERTVALDGEIPAERT